MMTTPHTSASTPSPTAKQVKAPNTNANERAPRVRTLQPSLDIYENEREFLLVADVPGTVKESLSIQFDRGTLSFEATAVEGPGKYPEGQTATYKRVFSVPDTVDSAKIDAELDAGVLRLRLPKVEIAKPLQIPVRGG